MAKEKVRLWDRLKYKYKLSVINETSYEEVFNFRLSQLHVLTALSVLAVILVVLTILLIAFTDLREFIPGYPDGNMRLGNIRILGNRQAETGNSAQQRNQYGQHHGKDRTVNKKSCHSAYLLILLHRQHRRILFCRR